jgi:transposase
MPRSLPLPLRRALCRRWQRGQGARDIADALGLAPRTVRRLLRRLRRGGPDALAPRYAVPRPPRDEAPLRRAALDLRRRHPTWGAPLIRVLLGHDFPRRPLPAARTLQRWFRRAGLAPAPRGRRRPASPRRAQVPHQVWQRDAAEQVRLGSGQRVSWLRVVDEFTGAVLAARVFSPGELGPRAGAVGAGGSAAGLPPLGKTCGLPRR